MLSDKSFSMSSSSSSDESSDNRSFKKDDQILIEQFVQDVLDFSSQYGSDYSISYTSLNLTGKPSKYPDYGDFPETFAMRTYGDWWNFCPSRTKEIMPQNYTNIPINDFIVVRFEEYVLPNEIQIFETYNGGAVVKIWAFSITGKWFLLWTGLPQRAQNSSRIFSPPINKMLLPTKIIRLEFNHSKLDYFTEIDAVMLIGKKYKGNWVMKPHKGRILKTLQKERFELQITDQRDDVLKEFLQNGLERFMEEAGLVSEPNINEPQITLKDLPCEILFKIMSYLDLMSLFRISQVSKNLYDVATDPFLYSEISLKPYWNCATSNLLKTLARRSRLIKKLDLSWCGMFSTIRSSDFEELIANCGQNLTNLRLNSCRFLNNICIDLIGSKCMNLTELSLRNFKGDSSYLWGLVALRNLERLDLFRSVSQSDLLFSILKNNPNLKHLNLGFCCLSVNMDKVAILISKFNKQIISIDMWKSHSLTSNGIIALSECHDLEEIDFGWCLREESSPSESLKKLLKGCKKLKKLFLAAIRGITDRDLENISNFCPLLEQLDLMGIMGISTEMCYKVLTKCKNLKLLDLSFCHVDDIQLSLWRDIFDASIKRSYVPPELLW